MDLTRNTRITIRSGLILLGILHLQSKVDESNSKYQIYNKKWMNHARRTRSTIRNGRILL